MCASISPLTAGGVYDDRLLDDGAGEETRTLTARLAERNDGSEALRPRTASGLSPTQLATTPPKLCCSDRWQDDVVVQSGGNNVPFLQDDRSCPVSALFNDFQSDGSCSCCLEPVCRHFPLANEKKKKKRQINTMCSVSVASTRNHRSPYHTRTPSCTPPHTRTDGLTYEGIWWTSSGNGRTQRGRKRGEINKSNK